MTEALGAGDVTKIGVGIIVVLVVIGVLISALVSAIIVRVIVLVVVIALGVFVWQQRTSVENKISKNECHLSATFFGIHLDAPQDVKQFCRHKLRS